MLLDARVLLRREDHPDTPSTVRLQRAGPASTQVLLVGYGSSRAIAWGGGHRRHPASPHARSPPARSGWIRWPGSRSRMGRAAPSTTRSPRHPRSCSTLTRDHPITLRQLLTMPGGLRSAEPADPWSDDARSSERTDPRATGRSARLEQPPGWTLASTNVTPPLVGMVLERATGEPVADHTARRRWQPLGTEAGASRRPDPRASGFESKESGTTAIPRGAARFGTDRWPRSWPPSPASSRRPRERSGVRPVTRWVGQRSLRSPRPRAGPRRPSAWAPARPRRLHHRAAGSARPRQPRGPDLAAGQPPRRATG